MDQSKFLTLSGLSLFKDNIMTIIDETESGISDALKTLSDTVKGVSDLVSANAGNITTLLSKPGLDAAGTVTSITPGIGLTRTKNTSEVDDAITDSGTINLKTATSSEIGGIQIGYTQSGKNYPVKLSSNKAYVNVPWVDTTYSSGTNITISDKTISAVDSVAITYSSLKTKVLNQTLVPGTWYKITDYKATINTSIANASANSTSSFYPVVLAVSVGELSPEARVTSASITTTSDTSHTVYHKYKIWYDIYNDTNKYSWANTSGKGVIYRMIDEYNNDLPYDFKNIQFRRYTYSTCNNSTTGIIPYIILNRKETYDNYFKEFYIVPYSETTLVKSDVNANTALTLTRSTTSKYFYTFSTSSNTDASINGYVKNVKMLPQYNTSGIQALNDNVFFNVSNVYNIFIESYCWENTFIGDCYDITIGTSCFRNVFFAVNEINIGSWCSNNDFYICSGINVLDNCAYNCIRNDSNIGRQKNIKMGHNCTNNYIGVSIKNSTLGNNCHKNFLETKYSNSRDATGNPIQTYKNTICTLHDNINNIGLCSDNGILSYAFNQVEIESGAQRIYIFDTNSETSSYKKSVKILTGTNLFNSSYFKVCSLNNYGNSGSYLNNIIIGSYDNQLTITESSLIRTDKGSSYAGKFIASGEGFFQSSDETLKTFENPIEIDFNKLSNLNKSYFYWNTDEHKTLQIGVSAQQIKEIYPELVKEDQDGKLTVSYDKLSVIALAAIDKLYKENIELKNSLNNRLTKLENKLK